MPVYGAFRTGTVAGSTSAKQLPDVPFRQAFVYRLDSSHAGIVLGNSNAVTAISNADSTTAGVEVPVNGFYLLGATNLNQYWMLCQNAAHGIGYIAWI